MNMAARSTAADREALRRRELAAIHKMAAQLGNRKLDNAEATKAEIVVTANPGCHLQLSSGLRQRGSAMRVRHIVELLDQSYRA